MKSSKMSLQWIAFCMIAVCIAVLHFPAQSQAFEISIEVAPNVLNLQNSGEVVTVHTSIAFSSVVGGSVRLNGIPIDWWKADNQGNFVAKFVMDEVKNLPVLEVPGENELTLVGSTTDGAEFTGTQTITVIDVVPSGSARKK